MGVSLTPMVCWRKGATRGQTFRGMSTRTTPVENIKDTRIRLATLRLYRMLQRSCKDVVPTEDGTILLQKDIQASDWGKFHFYENNTGSRSNKQSEDSARRDLLRLFLIWNDTDPDVGFSSLNDWYNEQVVVGGNPPTPSDDNYDGSCCWTTPQDLRETIRFAFRSSSASRYFQPTELQGWALRAIQMMHEQNRLWTQSSVSKTSDRLVRVTATSKCLGTISPVSAIASPQSPLHPRYRFAYRIRVENISTNATTVQLLGRYWHIAEQEDEHGEASSSIEPIEVDAPYTGAVGQLPVLQPGQIFEYVSGTDLATPTGIMKGHFYMATVPEKTKSAQSGDDVEAVTHQSSSSSNSEDPTQTNSNTDTRLFHAAVNPFRLESLDK